MTASLLGRRVARHDYSLFITPSRDAPPFVSRDADAAFIGAFFDTRVSRDVDCSATFCLAFISLLPTRDGLCPATLCGGFRIR